MIYPDFIKKGETIGICAPSSGVGGKIESFEASLNTIRSYGFNIKETNSVRNDSEPSSSPRKRGDEFNELVIDNEVKMIMAASGGDYNIEMLPYIDSESFKKNPKWVMGASDPTNILYYLTTKMDIATLYGHNAGSFDITPLHESLKNSIKIIQGEKVIQYSCDKYDGTPSYDKIVPDYNTDVYWTVLDRPDNDDGIITVYKTDKTSHIVPIKAPLYEVIKSDEYESMIKISEYKVPKDISQLIYANGYSEVNKLSIKGRLIGGCSDCILNLIGTEYDGTSEFIDRYGEDGIIWYFDPYQTDAAGLYRLMIQMKYCGYFKNTKAIIFGRIMFKENSSDADFIKLITKCFTDYDAGNGKRIPIIWNADIGHVKPALTLINGAMAELECSNGKVSLKMFTQ